MSNRRFDREVEVKVKVNDLVPIQERLRSIGCVLSQPAIQDDTIFTNLVEGWPEFNIDRIALRFREQDEKIIFTYKKSVSNELDKVERELEISDRKAMEDIIHFLGFKEIARVKKRRITTQYKDITICLDDVDSLGYFIEVEKLTNGGNGVKIQEELIRLLKSLGIDVGKRVTQGYDTYMFSKRKMKE